MATPYPSWVYLGTASSNQAGGGCVLYATASAASGTLDIDTITLIDVTDANNFVISLKKFTDSNTTTASLITNPAGVIEINESELL